jgi:N-acetylmuramoyl-L-alanine amidase
MIVIFPLRGEGNEALLPISFEGEQVQGISSLVVGKTPFLALPFFRTYLSAKVTVTPKGEIRMVVGSLTASLKVGEEDCAWNGKQERLKNAPRQIGDEVWLPLEIADRLGVAGKIEKETLALQWKGKYLLGIEQTNQSKMGYTLKITGDYTYQSFLLEKPDRLVIDLNGIELSPFLSTIDLAGAPVKGVRVSRFDRDTVRVVFDLDFLVGYKLLQTSTQPRELQLILNAFLKDVSFHSATKTPEIYIDTSYPVSYRTDYLFDPHRIVLDLWDVTLTGPMTTIPGNNGWVKNIRVSQFDPHTIRLVLEIKEPRNCIITTAQENMGRLVIKTVQELLGASWVKDGSASELVLRSSGEMKADPIFDEKTKTLLINLHHIEVKEQMLSELNKESTFRVREKDPAMVQVELPIPEHHQYSIMLNEDRSIMTIRIENAPLFGKIILLDPGHGGADAGAISRHGLREKDLNLDVAVRLKKYLENLGAQVLLTRDDDRYLWLYDRVAIANRVGAGVMISIHANNHDNPKINGLEVWHHPERQESAVLADFLAKEVIRKTKLYFRGIMASKDFVLPRETEMPTVIFEMGFISNSEEEKLLRASEFKDKIAKGLCQGLLNYFQTQTTLAE